MRYFKVSLLALVVLAFVLLLLANTRLGVFLVFDVAGGSTDNVDVDPDNGPLILSRTLSADSRYILPELVEQPSGIVFETNTIYVSTDQAELFTFDLTFDLLEPKADLLSGMLILKQGSVEAITIADSQVLGIGEIGVIGSWEKADDAWVRQEDIRLPTTLVNEEFTGICTNGGGHWATTSEALSIFSLEDGSTHPINLEAFTKSEGDVSSLLISGIDCDDEYFYLITENYTSIIVLNETFSVIEIVGIDAGEASDIAVRNRIAYVTVDHNYFDPRPPVYEYKL